MPMRTEPLGEAATYARANEEPEQARNAAFLIDGLSPGEPIFVLRGNDVTAVPMLNLYSTMAEGAFGDTKAVGLEVIRQEFVDYARRHPERLKLPD